MPHTYQRGSFTISTDPDSFDVDTIHSFLTKSYWARGAPKEVVAKSIKNSFCFGLFDKDKQIGFASVVTDYTHFAYVQDVFVIEEYRGRGLGKWLMECIISCPDLQGVRRIMLRTSDAHGFYRKCGFNELIKPGNWMEILFDRPWFKIEPEDWMKEN